MYIIWSRKKLVCSVLFAILGVSLGFLFKISPYSKTFFNSDFTTIIIDPGHGFPDGGAVGINGSVESEINLEISKKLQEVLTAKGFRVIMTRSDKDGISDTQSGIRNSKRQDMTKRLDIMKTPDAKLFVSIHMNFFPKSDVNGLRIFYSSNHNEIKPLAEQIQSKMHDVTGAKTAAVKTADKNLFLMKNPPIPAILVECGFLSNIDEEKKLNDQNYQSRLAWAIADAIEKYYK